MDLDQNLHKYLLHLGDNVITFSMLWVKGQGSRG